MAEEIFSPKAAAKEGPFSEDTLRKLRQTGEGPPYYKIGRRVFYRRDEFDAFVKARMVRRTSTSDNNGGANASAA
ncbi:MAG: helix-turn-helix domain-containing protein [Parvularculaceae bacterium]